VTRRLVMGTAGHIDHGKTALIKLLTGVDCDRLPEEKARGITIELGFAHLTLPSGDVVGVVDVPGHERFVRTMVAGAAGIDFALLVIAADEGVMPQTREHLAICRLLGIRHGLIALTKIDLVDGDTRELARAEAADFVAGTFLEGAPIVPVSAVTGEGQDDILAAIDRTARETTERSDSGIFRLPVDRVFTIKGFGVVATGACIGGRIAVGDEVDILPAGGRARVRGLQVHGEPVDSAGAGQRTAVNLQGVEVADVERGAVLATPGALEPTSMIDVDAELLSGAARALKRRALVRVHCGARETAARAVPLSAETLEPGGRGAMQLRLAAPLVALPGDRFVLRLPSPAATIGGGVVLHPRPRKHRAPYDETLADLATLRTGDLTARLVVFCRQAGRSGLPFARLPALLGVGEKTLRAECQKLLGAKRLVQVDAESERLVTAEIFAELKDDIVAFLTAFHRERPAEAGVNRAELLTQPAKGADPKAMSKALAVLVAEGRAALEGGLARLSDHAAHAGDELQKVVETVAEIARGAGLAAPTMKDLHDRIGDAKLLKTALDMLVQEKRLTRLGESLFCDAPALAEAERTIMDYLAAHGEIDAQGMKTLFHLSRKWAIPLSEYFDAKRITLRVGDKRVLRKRG